MKKCFLFIAMLTLVFVIAGCSGQTASSKDGKVVIRYGLWDKKQVPAIEQIIKKFNETNPNIEVKIELTPYA